jgi:hypothetical protein
MDKIMKEISECCGVCYRKGFYAKCNEGKYCIKKDFPYKLNKRVCTCGRSRRGVGLFCYCDKNEHIFEFDGFDCKQKSPATDVEVIDCKNFHPHFSQEDIGNHELTCYSCQREKTCGEDCLQKYWNLQNPMARNLSVEDVIEYHNHVFTRKLRCGKVVKIE